MRVLILAVIVAAAAGCGGTPDAGPIDSATEQAAEEELQREADREGKAQAGATRSPNPDDDD